MTVGIDGLTKVISNLKSLISPIINTGYNLQQQKSDVNLKSRPGTSDGLSHISISINAQTKRLHTKNDATYTLIRVPT